MVVLGCLALMLAGCDLKEIRNNSVESNLLKSEQNTVSGLDPKPGLDKPKESVKIPVLMLHYVREVDQGADPLGYNLSMTPAGFEKMLKYLTEHGYQTVHLEDVEKGNLPKKPIVITFDDGHEDFYTTAWPLLKKYNFTAAEAIISGKMVLPENMTPEQIKEIAAQGVEIMSHTVEHKELDKMSKASQLTELANSKKTLEDLLGKPVETIVYPAGKFNQKTLELAADAGYRYGLTTEPGLADFGNNLYKLHRIRIDNRKSLKVLGEELGEIKN